MIFVPVVEKVVCFHLCQIPVAIESQHICRPMWNDHLWWTFLFPGACSIYREYLPVFLFVFDWRTWHPCLKFYIFFISRSLILFIDGNCYCFNVTSMYLVGFCCEFAKRPRTKGLISEFTKSFHSSIRTSCFKL